MPGTNHFNGINDP